MLTSLFLGVNHSMPATLGQGRRVGGFDLEVCRLCVDRHHFLPSLARQDSGCFFGGKGGLLPNLNEESEHSDGALSLSLPSLAR